VAEAYDRFRPGPPPAALAWVLTAPVGTAADIGAGTGALTRELAGRADRVVAVEPDGRMLELLRRRSPAVSAVRGFAEHLPLRSASLDAALVSSAWHWMDPDRTIAEVGRVLRPGGVLGVIWNGADRSVDWVADLLGRRDPSPGDAGDRGTRHRFVLPAGSPFAEPTSETINWSRPMSGEDLIGMAGTYSALITMEPGERDRELARVRQAVVSALPEAGVDLPMSCRCWRAVRL
jgi:SAM-dependent methyltransferase